MPPWIHMRMPWGHDITYIWRCSNTIGLRCRIMSRQCMNKEQEVTELRITFLLQDGYLIELCVGLKIYIWSHICVAAEWEVSVKAIVHKSIQNHDKHLQISDRPECLVSTPSEIPVYENSSDCASCICQKWFLFMLNNISGVKSILSHHQFSSDESHLS